MTANSLPTPSAKDRIVDAIDIETFFYCKDESEAKQLANSLMAEMSLPQGDIVFLEHNGLGARVRLRSYIHLPGDHYRWLEDAPREQS
jgi:hypothetical protein